MRSSNPNPDSVKISNSFGIRLPVPPLVISFVSATIKRASEGKQPSGVNVAIVGPSTATAPTIFVSPLAILPSSRLNEVPVTVTPSTASSNSTVISVPATATSRSPAAGEAKENPKSSGPGTCIVINEKFSAPSNWLPVTSAIPGASTMVCSVANARFVSGSNTAK